MQLPVLQGLIDRRILINYQVAPDVLSRILPEPFRPKRVDGVGIGGICLIRLQHIRPQWVPGRLGFSSENAAHRTAVEWTADGAVHEGVYIPRRDTSPRLNTLVGGRIFPGVHHHARFSVVERDDHYRVALDSDDDATHVLVEGQLTEGLPATSVFRSLENASAFFQAGSLGYSATSRPGEYDGLELHTLNWRVEPLAVECVESSFFEDEQRFPRDTVRFDCALLMRGIQHEWRGQECLCGPSYGQGG